MSSDNEKNEIQNINYEMNNSGQKASKQRQNIHQIINIDKSDDESDYNNNEKKIMMKI